VVFVGQWRPEQRHNAVPEHLVHRALVAVHRRHHGMQSGVQNGPSLFWVEVTDQLCRAREVGKQHRHLFALAFQRAFGRQDLLGEVGGSVGERGLRLSRCEGGVRCLLTRPDQHRALLIHSTLSDLNKFHLQVVEVRVVKVELALERPVRHTAALAQQCENLIQHRVKVHR
jgi:hypothetical protein